MLIIEVHNDGTGNDSSANYNVRVKVNLEPIAKFRVEGHNRKDGWKKLLQKVAEKAQIQE